jgi:hypothetical protein
MNLRRLAKEIAPEPPILPVVQTWLRAVAADESGTEAFLAPPTTLVAATKPILSKAHEPAIELGEHGLVLLIGEPMAVAGFDGGGLRPE